jgi:hypothetical protein
LVARADLQLTRARIVGFAYPAFLVSFNPIDLFEEIAMRTRRRFQPTIHELPTRIAPSAVVVADTDMPETGTPVPILIAPDPGTPAPEDPAPTLLC